jgi:two-component sensor histidine kinase
MSEFIDASYEIQIFADSIPDIAWSGTVSKQGPQFHYFNARWENVTGKPPPKNADEFGEFIHPGDYEAARATLETAMRSATGHEAQWRLKQADGTYRWVLSRSVPSTNDPATARWFGTITDIDDAHRRSEGRALLARELSHRIKNIFSVISGLISLRSRGKPELEGFAQELTGTLLALGRAQDFVRPLGETTGEELVELLKVLMAPYHGGRYGGKTQVNISGDEVPFGTRAATPIALIFHELATNAAKYGALSEPGGTVDITITLNEQNAVITWVEEGGPPAPAPEEKGFGTRLIIMSIRNQLGGAIDQQWLHSGMRSTITIPRSSLET